MLYAIVDIETTGSHASASGITEIAIVIHDGRQILHQYETLVNPHREIPLFIQSLTGISDEMVAGAPSFNEVAGEVADLLRDKVFVAHNVNFDYSFVCSQLAAAGYTLETKKLCTVRLARKIIPGMKSYSLGRLCQQVGIFIEGRHRAGGDARATAALFQLLVSRDEQQVIPAMLKGKSKEQYLPPHLPVTEVEQLPADPGVYYFYDATGKVIYVGKAKNIARRVKSHFSNNKTGKQKQDFLREIRRISFTVCATELMAHILESTEIRRLWPVHNRSQRGYLPQFGLLSYEDRLGYRHLAIEKKRSSLQPVYTFNTMAEGHQRLRELIHEFGLCPRLCHLAHTPDCAHCIEEGTCSGHCTESAAAYNLRVEQAVIWLRRHLPSFAYMDIGIRQHEESCILIRNGNVSGMGYISDRSWLHDLQKLEQALQPVADNDYVRNLVYKHAAASPEKCFQINQ